MGLKIVPGQLKRNGRNVRCVNIYWDEPGTAPLLTISEIAQKVCATSQAVFTDITSSVNPMSANYLWNRYARPYLQMLENKTDKQEDFRELLGFFQWLQGGQESSIGAIKHPSSYLDSNFQNRIDGLSFAKNYGAPYQNWELDFGQINFLTLTPGLNQTKWQICSNANSVAQLKPLKVKAYKAAVKKLNPYLDRLEDCIDQYETATRKWSQNPKGGKPYLESLALLNMIERITDIFSEEDRGVEDFNIKSKELIEHAGKVYEKNLRHAAKRALKTMRGLYYNSGLYQALFDYLLLWDPSDHYYFHTIVANSVVAPTKKKGRSNRFDDRLFRAIEKVAQYLASDPRTAKDVALEANVNIGRIWSDVEKLAKKGHLASNRPIGDMRSNAKAMFSKLQQEGKVGLLTDFAVWCGYISSAIGNFYGPPTVLSLIITHFSKNASFVWNLYRDTPLKAFLMTGITYKQRVAIDKLIRSNKPENLAKARDLFENTSWRSPSLYAVFTLMGIAMLIYHVDGLVDQLEMDGDENKFEAELIKQSLAIAQDVANLGLTYLTIKYTRDLNAFMRENANACASRITTNLSSMDKNVVRLRAVKGFHGTIAFLGLALSVWDLTDNWGRSDNFERLVLAGTIASSLLCCLGVIGVSSSLGPAGFVAGLILAAILLIYQKYFIKGIENVLRALLDSFEKSTFYTRHKNLKVGTTPVYIIFEQDIHYHDLFDELKSDILGYDNWEIPDKKYCIRYFRTGLPLKIVAQIYETDSHKVSGWLCTQRYDEAQKQKRSVEVEMHFHDPPPGTILIEGILTQIRISLHNHQSISYIWMDPQPRWYNNNPSVFLWEGTGGSKLNTYDYTKNAVILRRTSRSRYVQVYQGGIRLNAVPPNNEVTFYVKALKSHMHHNWTKDNPPKYDYLKLWQYPVKNKA